MVLVGFPATVCTLIGQYGWCPWNRGSQSLLREIVPSLEKLKEKFQNRVFFRIVTRGSHPLLVMENAKAALTVLDACLPRHLYVVEVTYL